MNKAEEIYKNLELGKEYTLKELGLFNKVDIESKGELKNGIRSKATKQC